jgi:hypothetical protein
MKIAVMGASGLIGGKVVALLEADGHDVVAASRSSGVDVITGSGLAGALEGVDTLIDVLNAPPSRPMRSWISSRPRRRTWWTLHAVRASAAAPAARCDGVLEPSVSVSCETRPVSSNRRHSHEVSVVSDHGTAERPDAHRM